MPAPVKHTCPDIDTVIDGIKQALKITKSASKDLDRDSTAYNYITDIACELDGLDGQMEKLRKANSQLRDWGEDQEHEVSKLEERLENAESEIQTLRSELDWNKEHIRSLEEELETLHRRSGF